MNSFKNAMHSGAEAMRQMAQDQHEDALSFAQACIIHSAIYRWALTATDTELNRCMVEGMADGMQSVALKLTSIPRVQARCIEAVLDTQDEITKIFSAPKEQEAAE